MRVYTIGYARWGVWLVRVEVKRVANERGLGNFVLRIFVRLVYEYNVTVVSAFSAL